MKSRSIKNYFHRKRQNFFSQLENWNAQVFINRRIKKIIAIIPLICTIVVLLNWFVITSEVFFYAFQDVSFLKYYSDRIILILCFFFSTASLFLLYVGKESGRHTSRVFSVAVFLMGFFYISGYFINYSNSIQFPVLLSVNTAVGFLLLNVSLFLISFNSKNFIFFSQLFAFNLVLMAFLWIIGYMVDNSSLQLENTPVFMAFNNAGYFLLLGVGTFFIKPWDGIFSVLVMKSFGGIISRKLIPIILVISFLFIWIQYIGFNSHILNDVLVVGTILIAFISVFIYVVWKTVIDVNGLEKEFEEGGNELKRANERFGLAADAARFGIWDYNTRSKEVLWDDKLFEIYGIEKTPDVNIAEVWRKSFHPEDLETGLKEVNGAFEEKKNYYSEYRIIRPDGTLRYLKVIGKVVYGDDGVPLRMTGLMQDQSEFKLAEKEVAETESKYKYLFDENPVPIWIFDEESHRFLEVNNAAVTNYGYSREEFKAMNYFDIRPEEDIPKLKKMLESNFINRHIGTWRHLKKNGEIIHVDVKAHRIDYGERKARIVISNDVTRQKRAADRMNKVNDDLEEMISLRTQQLQDSNKELESFAYSVSHDLRAPLRHIIGFSRKLEKTFEAKDRSPEIDRLTGKIKESATKLGQLIDELLTFSRLGRSDINKNFIGSESLVNEVIKEFTIVYEKDKVEWKIRDLPEIYADVVLLRSVFQNLINNALKFSAKRDKIIIEIGCKANDNEYVFFVKDNGAGFNMEYVDKLFGVFQRLHNSEDFQGTGIGLATVKRAINMHGGRTWAEGIENNGATFFFSIPKHTNKTN